MTIKSRKGAAVSGDLAVPKHKKAKAAPGGAVADPFDPDQAFDEHIGAEGAAMSRGQLALEALWFFRLHGLPCPTWALDDIAECYEAFVMGRPSVGWIHETTKTPAARTLGEAFGVADLSRKGSLTRRLKAMKLPYLYALFSGPDALPRTDPGFKVAAQLLGIKLKQAKTWLPKTRVNRRGHKPYRAAKLQHWAAHDPFKQIKSGK